jgi:hypothetical protein
MLKQQLPIIKPPTVCVHGGKISRGAVQLLSMREEKKGKLLCVGPVMHTRGIFLEVGETDSIVGFWKENH